MRLKLCLAVLMALVASPAFAVNFCYVTEFPLRVDGTVQVAVTPPLADQQVTVSASSAQSAAFNASTEMVRISCDTTVSAVFGKSTSDSPTALTTSMRLPANVPEYFRVRSGTKVAFITNQ